MHIAKASEENLVLKGACIDPDTYDDHDLHINEHIRFLLSAEFKRYYEKEKLKPHYVQHIELHKKMKKAETEGEGFAPIKEEK